MRPFAHAEGHDLPWLVDEVVPGLAAQRDDVFVGFEDPVRQPVVAHELPDILHRVQLGRSWRQRQDGDVVGDRQLGRQVPTGLIDDQHRMGAGIDGGTDLDEVRRHGVGVAPGHDQPGALPLRGTDRAEDIGPFGALVAGRPRARATSGPSACELIPTVIDQNPCAHLRMPRDMIFHGWSMRLFQAWQHSATMSS